MKICSFCLLLPQYTHVSLLQGLAHYNLKKRDVESFPKFRGKARITYCWCVNLAQLGNVIILHQTLMTVANKKEVSLEAKNALTPFVHSSITKTSSEADCGITGCVRVKFVPLFFPSVMFKWILRLKYISHSPWIELRSLWLSFWKKVSGDEILHFPLRQTQ